MTPTKFLIALDEEQAKALMRACIRACGELTQLTAAERRELEILQSVVQVIHLALPAAPQPT